MIHRPEMLLIVNEARTRRAQVCHSLARDLDSAPKEHPVTKHVTINACSFWRSQNCG